jgi:general secretion pathway protein G
MAQNMPTGRKFAVVPILAESREPVTQKNRNGSERSARRDIRGFTMLELMVVIAIIMILLGLAAGRYQRSLVRAREAVLKQDLQVMRNAIQNYTMDKEAPPADLSDLVREHYLQQVPTDPITQQDQWDTVPDDGTLLTPEQVSTTGIMDVHSKSNEISLLDGKPYSSW